MLLLQKLAVGQSQWARNEPIFLFCLVRKFRLLVTKIHVINAVNSNSDWATNGCLKPPPSIPWGPTKHCPGTFPTTEAPFATGKRLPETPRGQQVVVSTHLRLPPLHTFPSIEASSAIDKQVLATPEHRQTRVASSASRRG